MCHLIVQQTRGSRAFPVRWRSHPWLAHPFATIIWSFENQGGTVLQHCSTAALQQSAAGLAVVARGAVFAQSGTAAKREPSGETPESPDISPVRDVSTISRPGGNHDRRCGGEVHLHLRGELPGGLDELLDDDVVFYSPIVFTPQRGKAITARYLEAAAQTSQVTRRATAQRTRRAASGASATPRPWRAATSPCSSSRPPSRAST